MLNLFIIVIDHYFKTWKLQVGIGQIAPVGNVYHVNYLKYNVLYVVHITRSEILWCILKFADFSANE